MEQVKMTLDNVQSVLIGEQQQQQRFLTHIFLLHWDAQEQCRRYFYPHCIWGHCNLRLPLSLQKTGQSNETSQCICAIGHHVLDKDPLWRGLRALYLRLKRALFRAATKQMRKNQSLSFASSQCCIDSISFIKKPTHAMQKSQNSISHILLFIPTHLGINTDNLEHRSSHLDISFMWMPGILRKNWCTKHSKVNWGIERKAHGSF